MKSNLQNWRELNIFSESIESDPCVSCVSYGDTSESDPSVSKKIRRGTTLVAFFSIILLLFASASQARTADNIKYSNSGQAFKAEAGVSILVATPTQIQDALGLLPSDVISPISTGTSDDTGFEVFSTPATLFPTQGTGYFVMSTGATADALTPNDFTNTSTTLSGLNNSQDNDMVQTVLVLQPPATARCLAFDFAFYSEEFPEYVMTRFNDAFIAEVGQSASPFQIENDQVTAPNNFAFDTQGNVIAVNTVFDVNAQNAVGTTYDGGTPLLTARTPLNNPGEPITVTLSIMDLGDSIYDSTVFIDHFQWLYGEACDRGASVDNPPVFGPVCNTTQVATVGNPSTFDVTASDPDAQDIVTLNAAELPAGAAMAPALPVTGNPVSSKFSWTPDAVQVGTHIINFDALSSAGGGSVLCPVTIKVEKPDLTITPDSLDFGTVAVGASKNLEFTVTNTGGGTLTGTAKTSAPFSIVSGGSFSLAAGASQSIQVRFSPTAKGSFPGSAVDFRTNAGDKLTAVTGNADDVNPPVFGPVCNTSQAATVGIAIKFVVTASDPNTGDIVTLNVAGLPDDAAMTPALPVTGNPVSSAFSWTPDAGQVGTHIINYTASSSAGGFVPCPVTIKVELPDLTITPDSLNFVTVVVGTSKDLEFTVTNTGGGTLAGTATTSAPFSIVSGGSFSLAAGASQSIRVGFNPTAKGLFPGTVVFTTNAGDDVFTAVTGIAFVPQIKRLVSGSF